MGGEGDLPCPLVLKQRRRDRVRNVSVVQIVFRLVDDQGALLQFQQQGENRSAPLACRQLVDRSVVFVALPDVEEDAQVVALESCQVVAESDRRKSVAEIPPPSRFARLSYAFANLV